MDVAEEVARAEREIERARFQIEKSGVKGGSWENVYGDAYQRLVRLGARPQIKRKYRGR